MILMVPAVGAADLELVDQLVPTKQLQQALRRQLPEGYTLDTAAGAPRVSLESVPFPAGLRPSARVLADAPVFASVMRQFACVPTPPFRAPTSNHNAAERTAAHAQLCVRRVLPRLLYYTKSGV